ncbi:MAG TPA: isocitrate lyase/phosphoenolpyruvate mutase family protein [Gemmatimonadaceae bacterium]|nr:isocitrate lyase/phosphoenolpyruvate mutase family protein [Gemmatimonadaceae bacterium]
MTTDISARRANFRQLHESGCFIIPNPWNVGSAKRLEKLGFKAIASTSSGAAWALGREDGEMSLDEVLAHLKLLCDATDLPVNADFEAGFADEPDGVATNVLRAIETGVAGLSIEDRTGRELYDMELAVDRMRAAREAIDSSGQNVLLVGRSEGFLMGRTELEPTIRRLRAYSEAGADCLYAPGIRDRAMIAEVVAAVAPKPVNVLLSTTDLTVPELAALGVRRVSVGGALAKATWQRFDKVASALLQKGTLTSPQSV